MGLIAKLRLSLLLQRAERIIRRGDWEGAAGVYRDALKLAEQESEPGLLFSILHRLGLLHYNLEDYSSACRYHRRAVDAAATGAAPHEQRADAHMNLANALSRLGHPEEAVEEYRRAAELAPDALAVLYNLAVHYSESGNPERAVQTLRDILASCRQPQGAHPDSIPVDTVTHTLLRLCTAQRLDEVFETELGALESEGLLAPAEIANLRAMYLRGTGRPQEAAALYVDTLKAEPRFHLLLFNLGVALLEVDPDRALEAFGAFAKACPDHPFSAFGEARALELLGRRDEARVQYRRFLDSGLSTPGAPGVFDFDRAWFQEAADKAR